MLFPEPFRPAKSVSGRAEISIEAADLKFRSFSCSSIQSALQDAADGLKTDIGGLGRPSGVEKRALEYLVRIQCRSQLLIDQIFVFNERRDLRICHTRDCDQLRFKKAAINWCSLRAPYTFSKCVIAKKRRRSFKRTLKHNRDLIPLQRCPLGQRALNRRIQEFVQRLIRAPVI